MAKIPIDISDLRKKADGDTVKELADYLEEKLGVDFELTGSEIFISYEDENPVSRTYLRVLLRKFLHRKELKEFRVIAGQEKAFIIKEKKIPESE